jgi:sigma-B regulation protein RsbU (phosphoserine phosphatase)
VVGVLTIESAEPDYFTTDHERILGVLSNQLAVALEHARLYDELRERTREMRTLIEIGHEITAILDLDRLLDTIAPLLGRVIPFDFLMVGLVDEEQQEFVWYVEDGYGAHANAQVNRSS